jgi:hypothetical protein
MHYPLFLGKRGPLPPIVRSAEHFLNQFSLTVLFNIYPAMQWTYYKSGGNFYCTVNYTCFALICNVFQKKRSKVDSLYDLYNSANNFYFEIFY